jgi:GNAT superfamily N-acetyltransferase
LEDAVPRAHVQVRTAVPDDAPALAAVWRELFASASGHAAARSSATPDPDRVRGRLADLAADPGRRVLVAEVDGVVVGAVHAVLDHLTPLDEATALRLSYLHVLQEHRRRGVGHALLAAAADWAQSVGAEQVVVDSHPGQRDTQRFLARVGLAQLLVQRSAPTLVLRRRLAQESSTAGLQAGERRLRRRLALGPARHASAGR